MQQPTTSVGLPQGPLQGPPDSLEPTESSEDEVVHQLDNLHLSDEDQFSQANQADFEERNRKIFVGGLSWMTTEDGLQHYFESLGMAVDRVIIMRDKLTGRSRGFGFVILTNSESVDKAVTAHLHLDGRRVEAKRAIPKHDMDNPAKKIFVGGIPVSLSNSEFRKYFETFGVVLETQVMTDRETGRSRGFGFVTFEDESVASQILKRPHQILGKPVEVKRAEPKKVEYQPSPIIMHPMTVPGVYLPPGFAYPTYGSPPTLYGPAMAYDPYFLGGLAYAPQYLPFDMDHIYDPVRPSNLRNVCGTTKAPQRKSSNPIDLRQKDWNFILPTNPQTTTSRSNAFSHVRIKPSEVRTERALSASLVPIDFTLVDPTYKLNQAETKRRGMSQPPTVNKRRTSQGPNSLVIGSSRRLDLNWRSTPSNSSLPAPPPGVSTSPTSNSDYLSTGISKFF